MTDFAALPVRRFPRVKSYEDAERMIGQRVPVRLPNVTTAGLFADRATGEPFLAYYPLDKALAEPVRAAVQRIEWTTSTVRASTGERNVSRTFGMAPRKVMMRRESCRPAGLAMSQPDEHAALVGLSRVLQRQLVEFAPHAFERDAKVMGAVDEEWRMAEDSLWTSGVVNKASALPYHRDRNNFSTWSAMPVFRRNMRGGHLHLPEYDLTVECRDGWVVYFPGFEHLHGVTPMEETQPGGYRYSVVYYALKGMKDCWSYAMEQARAQQVRTGREDHIANVIRGTDESRLKR